MPDTTESALLRQHAGLLFRFDAQGLMTTTNEPDGTRAPRVFLVRGRTSHLVRFRDDVPLRTRTELEAIAADLSPWNGEPSGSGLFRPIRDRLEGDAPIREQESGPAFVFRGGDASDARSPAATPGPGRFARSRRRSRPGGGDASDARSPAATPGPGRFARSRQRSRPGGGDEPAADPTTVAIDDGTSHLLDRHFPYTRTMLPWLVPVVGVVRDGAVVSACYSSRRSPTACEAGVWTEEPWRGHGFASLAVATWRDEVERAGAQPLYSTSWDNAASLAVARRLGLRAYAETVSFA